MGERTKLAGGLEKTATWVWLDPADGQLNVEYYDFSEDAQRMFGNDIAYALTVIDMSKLYSASKQNDLSLIRWLTENFKSYFGVKKWLEEQGIGFTVEIESHA